MAERFAAEVLAVAALADEALDELDFVPDDFAAEGLDPPDLAPAALSPEEPAAFFGAVAPAFPPALRAGGEASAPAFALAAPFEADFDEDLAEDASAFDEDFAADACDDLGDALTDGDLADDDLPEDAFAVGGLPEPLPASLSAPAAVARPADLELAELWPSARPLARFEALAASVLGEPAFGASRGSPERAFALERPRVAPSAEPTLPDFFASTPEVFAFEAVAPVIEAAFFRPGFGALVSASADFALRGMGASLQ